MSSAPTLETDQSLCQILKEKSQGTVAIFDKGDFYTVFGQDADLIARDVLFSQLGVRRFKLLDEEMNYLNLNAQQYTRVMRDLLTLLRLRVHQYSIEDGKWDLKATGTVGNLGDFEEILGSLDNTTIMTVKVHENVSGLEENRVSVAFCDSNEFRITVCEYIDSGFFSHIEQCIIGLSPRECLLLPVANESPLKKLSMILKKTEVMETRISKDEPSPSWENAVEMFKENTDLEISESLKLCVATLFDYLRLVGQEGFARKFQLAHFHTSGYMHIDAAAVQALELFSHTYSGSIESGAGTLYNTMNKCKTAPGQRMLREWIVRPLCDLRQIQDRQNVVSALISSDSHRQTLYDVYLPRLPDLAQLARRLMQNRAKLQDCYRIFQAICILRQFEHVIRQIWEGEEQAEFTGAIKDLLLDPVRNGLIQFERFVQLIKGTVDTEYYDKSGDFRIKPDIDPELLKISDELDSIEKKCEKAADRAKQEFDTDVKLDTNSTYGFFYRVTLKDEKSLREADVNILDTGKGAGIRFRDSTLEALNDEYKELQKVYEAAQKELEAQVVETCAGYATALSNLSASVASIDVLVAMASLAADSPFEYVRPEMLPMGSGIFEIEKCRHPVLEIAVDSNYIPNDVKLGSERLIILTGANMGGKSTYLRAAALCALMAQMGSRIPASSAKISVFDGIFTRVGASDMQCRGISTFMAEMLDSGSILERATANSFVIIDELGRGTSTFDGFGLAWAIANDLLERARCFCLFATHFHEMGKLADHENVRAMQMVVQVENGQLALLYEVRPGIAQSSFGLEVAKMVGFPDDVLKDATSVLDRLESRFTDEEEFIKKLKAASRDELLQLLLD